jgi:hypothetical protein
MDAFFSPSTGRTTNMSRHNQSIYREHNGIGYRIHSVSFTPPSAAHRAAVHAWLATWGALTPAQQAIWHGWTREHREASKAWTAAELTALAVAVKAA